MGIFVKEMKRMLVVMVLAGLMLNFGFSAADEKISITIWDSFSESGASEACDQINESFMKLYPNVEISRQGMVSEQMHPLIKAALSSGTGPDVVNDLTAAGYWRPMAKGELLMPLDEFYEEYDWNEKIFPWSKPFTTLGGNTYGVADELEFIGVFYNKEIFEKEGLSVPQTFEEFLDVCDKLKSAGYIPIAFANQGKFPAYHLFSVFANNILGSDGIAEILFGDGRWDTPEIEKAIKLFFVDMNEKGYLIPGCNGVTYDDGNMLFYTGRAAMHITGTWLIDGIEENMGEGKVDFFYFPSIEGRPIAPPAGFGSGWFISSNSPNSRIAAKYLDYRFSEEPARIFLEKGKRISPISFDMTGLKIPPLLSFVLEELEGAVEKGLQMGYNIDIYTPPNFNIMMGDGFQAVIAGQKTPAQQAADLQAEWEKAREEGLID